MWRDAVLVDPQRPLQPLRPQEGVDEGEELVAEGVLHHLDLHEHPGAQFNSILKILAKILTM